MRFLITLVLPFLIVACAENEQKKEIEIFELEDGELTPLLDEFIDKWNLKDEKNFYIAMSMSTKWSIEHVNFSTRDYFMNDDIEQRKLLYTYNGFYISVHLGHNYFKRQLTNADLGYLLEKLNLKEFDGMRFTHPRTPNMSFEKCDDNDKWYNIDHVYGPIMYSLPCDLRLERVFERDTAYYRLIPWDESSRMGNGSSNLGTKE